MKLAASILDIKEPKCEEVTKLSNMDIDYIHIDVMDGLFVENKTWDFLEYQDITKYANKPKDVHLMVSDVRKYIDEFSTFNPDFITFHYEAVSDVMGVINYIKEKGIGVGMSIKPSTDITEIAEYLEYLDLILVMSVEPGRGGQTFMDSSIRKMEQLSELRNKKEYNYLIEVDGGINNETIRKCVNADIVVVGSYITKNDYKNAIEEIRRNS